MKKLIIAFVVGLLFCTGTVFALNFDYVFTTTATVSVSVSGSALIFNETGIVGVNEVHYSSGITVTNDGVGAVETYKLKTTTQSGVEFTFGGTKDDNGINKIAIAALFSTGTVSSVMFNDNDVLTLSEQAWMNGGTTFEPLDPTGNGGNVEDALKMSTGRKRIAPGVSTKLFLRLRTPTAVTEQVEFRGRVYISAGLGQAW
jgi:hypothetical protein